MRYDVGLPKERILLLESIVDGVLGIQEESYEEHGVTFYREDLYHAAIFSEDFIKEFADAMTTDYFA